jgi:hypothetical protein
VQTQGLEWARGRAVFEGRLDERDFILATNLMLYRRDQQTGDHDHQLPEASLAHRRSALVELPCTLTLFFGVPSGLPGNAPIQGSILASGLFA